MTKSSRNHPGARRQRNVTKDAAVDAGVHHAETYDFSRKKKNPIKFQGTVDKILDTVFSLFATISAICGKLLYKAIMSPEAQSIFGFFQWLYFFLISIDNFYVLFSDELPLVPSPGISEWVGFVGYNPLSFKVNLTILFFSFLAMGAINMNQTLLLGICFNERAQKMSAVLRFSVIPMGAAAFIFEFWLAFHERPCFQEGQPVAISLLLFGYNILSVLAISAGAHFWLISMGQAESVGKTKKA
ncbi:hypothetical protein [Moorena sp. SIO3A2]|uniref:hypothetical protein n=1 Tax=Moorena sp. SIO3A2 TaxID=2607841 RepID=UPI0013BA79B8|nr:hypothetical protein [Moorena sp. SIO3A2]NER90393.1 hypothetical protein [Moorena sp. SIO3A2]